MKSVEQKKNRDIFSHYSFFAEIAHQTHNEQQEIKIETMGYIIVFGNAGNAVCLRRIYKRCWSKSRNCD